VHGRCHNKGQADRITRLVVGESAFIDESLSDYESLRVLFEVAQERGHSAPTIVVDERGVPLTHPDYADRMGTAHLKAGAWAFCRRPAAEALGLPSGTDWVRDHATRLMFYGGSPYLPQPHLHDHLYIQRFGDAWPSLLPPVSVAGPVAWNNEGSRLCTVETRLGHLGDNSGMAIYVLWEYEVHSSRRRQVAAFPASLGLDFTELTYSPDDGWLHLCQWAQGRNLLVRIADGLVLTLPVVSSAMGWNPGNGPNFMIAMVPDRDSGVQHAVGFMLRPLSTLTSPPSSRFFLSGSVPDQPSVAIPVPAGARNGSGTSETA
jgi:hypothetical protein